MGPFKQVPRISNITPQDFYSDYIAPGQPVIITDITKTWPAIAKWSPEFFYDKYKNLDVKIEIWRDEKHIGNSSEEYLANVKMQPMKIGEFIDQINQVSVPSRKYYLAQFPIFEAAPELLDDIGELRAYMNLPAFYPTALAKKFISKPNFWFGPNGVISTIHFDPSSNLFAQLYGRKRFILISPEQSSLLYYPSYHLPLRHFSPVDIENPDLNRFPLVQKIQPLEAIVNPGEVLFIPVTWWHHVRSLETSISLSFWWINGLLDLKHNFKFYYQNKIRKRT